MNLELRILNGLHRGAALPLDGAALELGGGEQADVVLADPGLAPAHARLLPDGDGWSLVPLEGAVFGAADAAAQERVALAAGGCARLGEIWLCVSPLDAAWQSPPPPPAASPDVAASAASPDAAPQFAPAAPRARSVRPTRWKRFVLLPFGAMIVLCAAAAYAMSARPIPAAIPAREAPAADTAAAAAPDPTPGPAAAPRTRGKVPPPLTARQLRSAFRRELSDAQLLDRFDLTLDDAGWRLRADLDDEEKGRFERLLKRFLEAHQVAFPVDARIVPPVAMLPFTIEQVLSGEQAGIVTGDGKRLFVGDEYRGTRLVALKDKRLTFAGKRKIEVDW